MRLCCCSLKGAVGFGGHDEVVAMEAADFVGPPVDGDVAPFGDEHGVMTFFFGDASDFDGEVHCLLEISEAEAASESIDAVDLDEVPIANDGM